MKPRKAGITEMTNSEQKPMSNENQLPNKRMLRYGEVRAYLGVSDRDMKKFREAGLLERHYLPDSSPKGKAYYFRTEVLEFERNWKAKEKGLTGANRESGVKK